MLSDKGTQFTSDMMKEVMRNVSIKLLFMTPYNPKCYDLCEKINGTLKSMLRKICQKRPKDWDCYLPAVLFAYREAPLASTGFSPFELIYGRTVRGPMQVLKEIWTEAKTFETQNTYQYVLDLRKRLKKTCQIAQESLMEAKEDCKHHYDKKKDLQSRAKGQYTFADRPQQTPTSVERSLQSCRGSKSDDYKVDVDGKKKLFHANC